MVAPMCKKHGTLMHPIIEGKISAVIIYDFWVCDECEKEIIEHAAVNGDDHA